MIRIAAAALAALAIGGCAAPRPAGPVGASDEARFPPPPSGNYGQEPAVEATPLERAAMQAVAARAASAAPRPSPSLVLAARALAGRGAHGSPSPLDPAAVRAALAGALAYDYAPVAHLVSAGDGSRAAALLAERAGAGASDATHLGAGAVVRGGQTFLALLLARRTATLRPFPRDVAVGVRAALQGQLLAGLDGARVFVTSPSGESREVPAAAVGGAFHADLAFDVAGRWDVEVVGRGARGPEVVAMLVVACGGASLAPPATAEAAEPADVAGAESAVVNAVNRTRRARRLPPLETSTALAAVARRHSEAMLSRGVLAHVLPGTGDVGERLRRARVPYRLVLENVAKGATALAAHRAAEESPAHLANILSREVDRVGCGVARGRLPTGEPIAYLTEIFVQPVADGAGDRMAPDERVREALWRERSRIGAPPLASDPALDALARNAAREMLQRGEPHGGDRVGEEALRLGRRISAVDAFVATTPADAARSRNLPDARLLRVGVGVAVGDSARHGAGLLWIAVVYTD